MITSAFVSEIKVLERCSKRLALGGFGARLEWSLASRRNAFCEVFLFFLHGQHARTNVTMTGKRKRDVVAVSRHSHAEADLDRQSEGNDVLRKYFESVFEPLPESKNEAESLSESSEGEFSGDEDDWEGFSDESSDPSPTVQVIEHNTESASDANPRSGTEFKAFMVSQPSCAIHWANSVVSVYLTSWTIEFKTSQGVQNRGFTQSGDRLRG